MLDKNQPSKYLWYICKLSYILKFINKKTNFDKIGISTIPVHLDDNEIG